MYVFICKFLGISDMSLLIHVLDGGGERGMKNKLNVNKFSNKRSVSTRIQLILLLFLILVQQTFFSYAYLLLSNIS